jgi:hypothetical protein
MEGDALEIVVTTWPQSGHRMDTARFQDAKNKKINRFKWLIFK